MRIFEAFCFTQGITCPSNINVLLAMIETQLLFNKTKLVKILKKSDLNPLNALLGLLVQNVNNVIV